MGTVITSSSNPKLRLVRIAGILQECAGHPADAAAGGDRPDIRGATLQSMSSLLKRSKIFLLNRLVDLYNARFGIRDEHLEYLQDHLLTIILFMLCETTHHIWHNAGRAFAIRAFTIHWLRRRVCELPKED